MKKNSHGIIFWKTFEREFVVDEENAFDWKKNNNLISWKIPNCLILIYFRDVSFSFRKKNLPATPTGPDHTDSPVGSDDWTTI